MDKLGVLTSFIHNIIVYNIPLLYGTVGEIVVEKSGSLNLGVEGIMAVGAIFIDKKAHLLNIEAEGFAEDTLRDLSDSILQAARIKFVKTEYISCPGCGRTLYDLEGTIHKIKAATAHLKGLKIAIMGCIVNGPGEMADADYGYVGAARGKVSLYKAKECIEKNIPEEEAVERLLKFIEEDLKQQ